MPLPHSRHLLPVALVVLLSLVVPVFAFGGTAHGPVQVTASVTGDGAGAGVPPQQAFPIDGPVFAKARDLAVQHWGAQPCGGQVQLAYAQLDAGTNATASWQNPTDAWNNAAQNFGCRIDVNTGADFDFPKLCTVLTHEYGHLLGQQHVAEPGQLMSPVYTDPLPECVAGDPNPPQPEPVVEESSSETTVAARPATVRKTVRPAARKTTLRSGSSRRTARTSSKRCVRRFSAKAGRRVTRCAKAARAAKRPVKARR